MTLVLLTLCCWATLTWNMCYFSLPPHGHMGVLERSLSGSQTLEPHGEISLKGHALFVWHTNCTAHRGTTRAPFGPAPPPPVMCVWFMGRAWPPDAHTTGHMIPLWTNNQLSKLQGCWLEWNKGTTHIRAKKLTHSQNTFIHTNTCTVAYLLPHTHTHTVKGQPL